MVEKRLTRQFSQIIVIYANVTLKLLVIIAKLMENYPELPKKYKKFSVIIKPLLYITGNYHVITVNYRWLPHNYGKLQIITTKLQQIVGDYQKITINYR